MTINDFMADSGLSNSNGFATKSRILRGQLFAILINIPNDPINHSIGSFCSSETLKSSNDNEKCSVKLPPNISLSFRIKKSWW